MLARGDGRTADTAYRFFDEQWRPAGAALGHDGADRAPGRHPLRRALRCRCASVTWPTLTARCGRSGGRCASSPRPGVELIGAPAPDGTAEVVEVLEAALDAAGLDRAVIGLGDADLYRQLLDRVRHRRRGARLDPRSPRRPRPGRPRGRSFPSCRGSSDDQVATCVALSQLRGGKEVLDEARALGGAAVERATARLRRDAGGARGTRSSPSGSRSTSASCATSAITAARSSRSTTRRWVTCSAAAAATTACSSALALTSQRPALPSTWSASTSPRWRRSRAGVRVRECSRWPG